MDIGNPSASKSRVSFGVTTDAMAPAFESRVLVSSFPERCIVHTNQVCIVLHRIKQLAAESNRWLVPSWTSQT